MVAVEDFGDGIQVAGEVALCALWHTLTAPGEENMLGKRSVRVLDFNESKLNAAFAKVFNEIGEFALCSLVSIACQLLRSAS